MQAGTGDNRHVPRVWPCPVVEGKARRSQPGVPRRRDLSESGFVPSGCSWLSVMVLKHGCRTFATSGQDGSVSVSPGSVSFPLKVGGLGTALTDSVQWG